MKIEFERTFNYVPQFRVEMSERGKYKEMLQDTINKIASDFLKEKALCCSEDVNLEMMLNSQLVIKYFKEKLLDAIVDVTNEQIFDENIIRKD